MLRAMIVAPRRIELKEASIPQPGPGEVLVENKYMAICGSNHRPYLGVKLRGKPPQYPMEEAGGHEGGGYVVQPGEGVENLRVGDRVAISHKYCRFSVEKAERMTVVPPGISDRDVALLENVIDVYQGMMSLGVTGEETLFISGLGPAGAIFIELARARGCRHIIGADVLENRLKMARELGATMVVSARAEDLVARVREATEGGVTVAVDTCGVAPSILNALHCTAPYGRVGLYARSIDRLDDFDTEQLIFEQRRTLRGLKNTPFNLSHEARMIAISLIERGIVSADRIITHEFDLKDVEEAFEMAAVKKEGLKVVVRCS